MGRKRIKRRGQVQAGRPSAFFLIALAIGVAVLIIVFVQVVRHPQKQPLPAPHVTELRTRAMESRHRSRKAL